MKLNKTVGQAHQVRIIAGMWRQTKLPVIDANQLRPTADRVKETLFNWLNNIYMANFTTLTVLDVFAGSGALGFEAASRGFAAVTLLESNKVLVRQLVQVKNKLKADMVQIYAVDGWSYLAKLASKSVEIIFLDPPFASTDYPSLIKLAASKLTKTGLLYVEIGRPLTEIDYLPLQIKKSAKVGAVYFYLLEQAK